MSEKYKFLCKWCEKEFKTQKSLQGHYGKCKSYIKYIRDTVTEDKLKRLYIEEGRSCVEIAEILGLESFSAVYRMMIRYKIPRRTLKQASSCEKSKSRRAKTSMKRHGSPHNFCRNHPSRKEWEERLLQEEGIINVFQRPEVIEKIQKTIAERYPDEDPRYRPVRGRRVYSKIHREVVKIIENLGYHPRIERKFYNFEDRHRILYSFDIYLPPNLLIEVNGDMWHGNPDIYKAEDLIPYYQRGYFPVKEKWNLDKEKIDYATRKGFKVLVVWEKDLKDNKELTINRIQKFIEVTDDSS